MRWVDHITCGLKFIGLKFIGHKFTEQDIVTDQIIIVQFQVFMNILHYILIKLDTK